MKEYIYAFLAIIISAYFGYSFMSMAFIKEMGTSNGISLFFAIFPLTLGFIGGLINAYINRAKEKDNSTLKDALFGSIIFWFFGFGTLYGGYINSTNNTFMHPVSTFFVFGAAGITLSEFIQWLFERIKQ